MSDLISRQSAIDELNKLNISDGVGISSIAWDMQEEAIRSIKNLPSVEPEEVIPHRNYKYLSDYWCECGWHLGKKGEVKYCAECGRKVNWDG